MYNDILEIKDEIQFDKTLFGFFNRCFKVNEVLSKYNFFLKFFERRDKYRFLIQKKVERKNKVTRDLLSSVIEKFNRYEIIKHKIVKTSLLKTTGKWKKHTDVCTAKEGTSYCFQNDEMISFNDNFKYLGNLPFTVYFDFETTTGDAVIFDPKMYVISYCQIHPSLNLDKIEIFRSFQQKADEIYDLSHFKHEHVPFFDKTAFY